MKTSLYAMCVIAMAVNITACGTKGSLKSPSQIEAEAVKKERKAAQEKARAEKEAAKVNPPSEAVLPEEQK